MHSAFKFCWLLFWNILKIPFSSHIFPQAQSKNGQNIHIIISTQLGAWVSLIPLNVNYLKSWIYSRSLCLLTNVCSCRNNDHISYWVIVMNGWVFTSLAPISLFGQFVHRENMRLTYTEYLNVCHNTLH